MTPIAKSRAKLLKSPQAVCASMADLAGNGTPSTRLWHIGTHHLYGIYSNRYGFAHDSLTLDNEAPELHFDFPRGMTEQGGWTVYGDFEVCPLEPLAQGHMQAACIAGATHIVVSKQ